MPNDEEQPLVTTESILKKLDDTIAFIERHDRLMEERYALRCHNLFVGAKKHRECPQLLICSTRLTPPTCPIHQNEYWIIPLW